MTTQYVTYTGAATGVNSGDVTLTSVGSSPAAAAASISGQALTLQPADGTHPGVVTSGTQPLGGNKTFSGTVGASNLSGTNTGDVTLASVGSSPAAAGASLAGQVLTLQPANGTTPGVVSTAAQAFGGAKTFNNGVIVPKGQALTLDGVTAASKISADGTTDAIVMMSGVADVANVVANIIDTAVPLNAGGGIILSVRMAGVEKMKIDRDGSFTTANFALTGGQAYGLTSINSSPAIHGKVTFDSADATGTPGNATINQPSGRAAIASGAQSVTITNSFVTTASVVMPILQTNDAVLNGIDTCICSAGSFIVKGNGVATGNVNFGFVVFN